jgi:hypothetical protein
MEYAMYKSWTLLAIVAAIAVNTQPVRAQPIAAWHFDESSGSSASPAAGAVGGTLVGNAAFVAGGINGNAVSMTQAGNGLVDMGNNFDFGGNSTFSLVAWVKLNPGDTTGYLVTGRHQANVVAGYFLSVNNAGSGSGEVTGSGMFYQAYPNPLSGNLFLNDGNWHQLVGVHDFANNQSQVYVDGILRDTKTYTSFASAAANFSVGGALNVAGNQMIGAFTGSADEVSIWGQALTGPEVLYLYNNPGVLVVPEPSSIALLGVAGIGALVRFRRSRAKV